MYDFLDKIGLKAVLEAVKGKIPTSLPANGGNADTLDGLHASDFAKSRNSDLMTLLNGQSGDIRSLAYQLSNGGYIFNTTRHSLKDVIFPIAGDGILSWATGIYNDNGLRYGILIVRPMTILGDTCICSVYNNTIYTDWQRISTTPIGSSTVVGTTDKNGNLALWPVSNNEIPISAYSIESSDIICTPFIGNNCNSCYLAIDSAYTHEKIANTSVTVIVNYIRK